MNDHLIKLEIQEVDDSVTHLPPVLGQQIVKAPQPALTAASGTSLSNDGETGLTAADSVILANAITRIGELETALKNLGLIK